MQIQGFSFQAGVKTARWSLLDDLESAVDFASDVGYPIVVKLDNGVGASNTWKLTSEAALIQKYNEILSHYPAHHFIMEEFVPGHVETFDGITDGEGNVMFCASQVMRVTPLDML